MNSWFRGHIFFLYSQAVFVWGICSSCNMGTSDLPEIYTRARGRSPSASVYISGKSQVPMLQLIYSTWVTQLQAYMETAGMLSECIYMGPCDFQLWVTS